MGIKEIENSVRESFRAVYEEEYRLILLWQQTSIGQMGFAISKGNDGIIVEFYVSRTGIFSASSKGELLNSPWEIENWKNFIKGVKRRLEINE